MVLKERNKRLIKWREKRRKISLARTENLCCRKKKKKRKLKIERNNIYIYIYIYIYI